MLAERVGFEPTVVQVPQRFSRPPRSTTPAPLRKFLKFLIIIFAILLYELLLYLKFILLK